MSGPAVLKMQTWEGTSPIPMARLVDDDDANVQQAGVASIAYTIYDLEDDSQESASTLTVASVIYDTPQTGKGWSADTEGYNFRWKIAASLLPVGTVSKKYLVEIIFTAAGDGDKTIFSVEIERRNTRSQAPA